MRILNRPMFRYGGPIKEGVMHGMRNGGRAALVGNPMFPQKGGRALHAEQLSFWPKVLEAGKKTLTSAYKKPVQTILPGKKIKAGAGIMSSLAGRIPKWWDKIKPTRIPKIKRGDTSLPIGMRGPLSTSQLTSVPLRSRILPWMRKNPGWTGAGALYGAAPAYGISKAVVPKLATEIADRAVPDWIYNWETGRWFNPDDTDLKPGDKKILEEKKIEAIGSGAQFKESTAPELTDSQRTELARDQQNKRLKSYLDMMGYDSAKRGALDKALIDASALVQDATTEAGSLKKADWGKLINRMIQTTSKRLDKPEQIREAVGLMMTKGEIEKDLLQAKGGSLKQNARDLVAAGVYKTEKEAMAHLGKKAGFEEVVGALSAKKDVTGKVLADAWRISGEGIPTAHVKGSDDLYKNFKEKAEDAGGIADIELNFVTKEIPDRKAGEVYIIDDRLIIIQEDGTPKYKW